MIVTLGTVGTTYGGLTGKTGKDFGHGAGRYVSFTEVMTASRLVGKSLEFVDVRKGERQNEVRRGDVLFNGSSETPEEVALAAVVDFDVPRGVYLNSFCFGYRLTREGVIDPAYLAYFFRSAVGREVVFGLAQGATRYNISKTKLLQTPLDLPPFEEQQRIAATLADCDDLIASLELLITKKQNIKQGMMQELLTGQIRVPDSDGTWRTCSISNLATIVKGQQLGRAEMSVHGEVEVWNGGIEPSGFTVAPNIFHAVVTVSEGGNSCGWVGKPQSGFWLGGHCYALTPKSPGLPIEFLYQLLKFRELDLMALRVGSGLPNIQKRALLDFPVRVPVDSGEASCIAEILKDADAEIAALERRLISARSIKQGMMQELLTGRTRLPVEAAA